MPYTDMGPVRTVGELELRRARILWHDGKLHVFRTNDEFWTFDAPQPPERNRGYGGWEYTVDGVDLKWMQGGCACSCSVCRTARSTLLATATASVPT